MSIFSSRKSKAKAGHPKLSRLHKLALRRAGVAEGAEALPPPVRSRGIYLLPNAFTTAALFCGFYAIVMAMNMQFRPIVKMYEMLMCMCCIKIFGTS